MWLTFPRLLFLHLGLPTTRRLQEIEPVAILAGLVQRREIMKNAFLYFVAVKHGTAPNPSGRTRAGSYLVYHLGGYKGCPTSGAESVSKESRKIRCRSVHRTTFAAPQIMEIDKNLLKYGRLEPVHSHSLMRGPKSHTLDSPSLSLSLSLSTSVPTTGKSRDGPHSARFAQQVHTKSR